MRQLQVQIDCEVILSRPSFDTNQTMLIAYFDHAHLNGVCKA